MMGGRTQDAIDLRPAPNLFKGRGRGWPPFLVTLYQELGQKKLGKKPTGGAF